MARVLIVDDDPGTRSLLARWLTRDIHVPVTEASNGLEALDLLSRESYSLVLLDARMPILDGVETLQVIRQSPELQHLPVCMMTVDRNEHLVQRAIALGVNDFVLKPFNTRNLGERLGALLNGTPSFGGPTRKLVLDSRTRVLVVDDDSEFREFFLNHLAPRCNVTQCSSGVDAMKSCLRYFPDAIFVGPNIGLVTREMLTKKVRALSSGAHTLLVAVVDAPGNPPPDGCDSIMLRSLDPTAFWASFTGAVGLDDLTLHADSPIVQSVVRAVQQVCSMQLGLDVTAAPATVDDHRRDWCCARLDVRSVELGVGIEAGMPVALLRDALGAVRQSASPYEVSDQDIAEAVKGLAHTAGSRLLAALSERGMTARIASPAVAIEERGGDLAPPDAPFAASLISGSGEVHGQLLLWQHN